MNLAQGILATAQAIGADPIDLATVISYETAGTFDPAKAGPTTQWGQHRGLIQFGEPQAREYGVDWSDPIGSQLGPQGAVARYLQANGYRPGMGLLDLYSTINAGAPGRYGASDANNGGAPGTVRDKVETQMAGHRQNAERLLSGQPEVRMSAMNAPAEPQRQSFWDKIGIFRDPDQRARLAMALEGMTLNPNVGLMRSLEAGIDGRRQDRRANATEEWLRSQPGGERFAGLVGSVGGTGALQAYMQSQQGPDQTSAMQNYQFLLAQGVEPGEAMQRAFSGGTTVNVGPDGRMGSVPAGYVAVEDRETASGYRLIPIDGSEAARAIAETEQKQEERQRQTNIRLGGTLDLIDLNLRAIEDGGLPVTGAVGEARRTRLGQILTGSDAVDFGNRNAAITDQAALSEIQRMRDNSPTGGAVGALTDGERVAIGNAVTALNAATSAEEYTRAARAYRKLVLDLAFGEGAWSLDEGSGQVTLRQGGAPAQTVVDGYTIREAR